jgi:hypothetical protein
MHKPGGSVKSHSFGECPSLRKLCSTVGLLAISVATAAQTADVQFADITGRSGVDFTHENSATSNKYLIETMGGGVALFDYTDIFFTNGALLLNPVRPEDGCTMAAGNVK